MKLSRTKIQSAVKDKKWQSFRESLKGKSTASKKRLLLKWLVLNKYSDKSNTQVKNYINALKRAGLYR